MSSEITVTSAAKGEKESITPSLRSLQLIELEIAKKFIAFCDEHNLRYFMIGGTFLGAVRHKGFIPWDDDMDFAMYREDYDRFLQLCKTEPIPFEVCNFFYNKINANGRYQTKIEDPDSMMRVRRVVGVKSVEMKVWIDIFPLDGMPNSPTLRIIWGFYLMWRRAAYMFSVFNTLVDKDRKKRPFMEKILIAVGKYLPVEKIFPFEREIKKFDKALKIFRPVKSSHVFQPVSPYKLREIFNKEIFGEGRDYEFEGMKWRGPEDSSEYLRQLYGDSYLILPPEHQRNWHRREEIIIGSRAQ